MNFIDISLDMNFFRILSEGLVKATSVITGPKRNKVPICKNISNPGVLKVLSVITLGPNSNVWKDKVTIPVFGNIRSEFQCLEE